jgi:hypothetical protein
MIQAETSPYVRVADIEVNDVRPEQSGFVLQGRGADRADYRLEVHFDMPVDSRTRAVLGGLLAQSEWRVWRRSGMQVARPARQRRAAPGRKA